METGSSYRVVRGQSMWRRQWTRRGGATAGAAAGKAEKRDGRRGQARLSWAVHVVFQWAGCLVGAAASQRNRSVGSMGRK